MEPFMTTTDHNARISKLEIMFSEQEYTIETLNTVITRQDRDIGSLQQQLELLKLQLREMKKMLPEGEPPGDEKPPHY
jgi:SlyX protein